MIEANLRVILVVLDFCFDLLVDIFIAAPWCQMDMPLDYCNTGRTVDVI